MMTLQSKTATVKKNQETCFDFLSQPANYEKIMPENTEKFALTDPESFLFQLKGMPEIALRLKEKQLLEKVILEAGGGKIDFTLTADLERQTETETQIKFRFEGQLSPMLEMMVKKPLKNFIDTLSENLKKI